MKPMRGKKGNFVKVQGKILWGTSMRNPRTACREEYVAVLAESIKELETFYNAIGLGSQAFDRKRCRKCKVSRLKP